MHTRKGGGPVSELLSRLALLKYGALANREREVGCGESGERERGGVRSPNEEKRPVGRSRGSRVWGGGSRTRTPCTQAVTGDPGGMPGPHVRGGGLGKSGPEPGFGLVLGKSGASLGRS